MERLHKSSGGSLTGLQIRGNHRTRLMSECFRILWNPWIQRASILNERLKPIAVLLIIVFIRSYLCHLV